MSNPATWGSSILNSRWLGHPSVLLEGIKTVRFASCSVHLQSRGVTGALVELPQIYRAD